MSFDVFVVAHILVGTTALAFYWATLLTRKGSAPHRAAGRRFSITLLAVAASVGPLLLLGPGAAQPAYVVQFAYLASSLVAVTVVGWTAIRWKGSLERFRGAHFKAMGPLLFVMGGITLTAGLSGGDPLAIVLSWVGLAYGAAMMRFAWMRAPAHPLWWLNWHLNAVCGLFTAVHGTVFFVLWRWLVAPEAPPEVAAAFHVGVLAVAVLMRLAVGRRRGIPLRFSAHPSAASPAVAASG